MNLEDSKLQEIHNILDTYGFEWVNTGHTSEDWKQRIYECRENGLQLSIMDRKRISFRLETEIKHVSGVKLRDKCPKGSTLDASYSHFKNNSGFCYFANTIEEFGKIVAAYINRPEHEIPSTSFEHLLTNFQSTVDKSLLDDSSAREARLATSSKLPKTSTATITVYSRNPDVVAHVLLRADGSCEQCERPAPFIRRSNSTPYLEVHHCRPLAIGGEDSVENALALCPNCHREAHYGPA